ncbi:MAG: hypothetical protein WBH57_00955 [Anaerolineae bacterium]
MWLPEWAAKSYVKLYYRFRDRPFDFAGAQELLGYGKAKTARTLQEIENSGLLHRGRLSTDLRRRTYGLISLEQFALALALSQESQGLGEKLSAASQDFQYVITGAAAAYKYHGYMTPAKTDILIYKEDFGFWIALLKEKQVQIAVDDALAEKRGTVIHLHTNLTEETFARAAKIDGIYYTSVEDLVLDFFRHPTDTSLLDALAIMVTCAEDLDWDLLAKSDVTQELGFAMEVLNKEAGKEVFSKKLIEKFAEREVVHKRFSISTELLKMPNTYRVLARNWELEVNVPPRIFQKATSDLVS